MIPAFDHNFVLPPHTGNPTLPEQISPYKCTTEELCSNFATSAKRIEILEGFLLFRQQLSRFGLVRGFQWLDGSFLENVEIRENRSPNDLDLVTVYWGYDLGFQQQLIIDFPEFADTDLSKSNYKLDHYPFDAGHSPMNTVEYTRYWIQLFSHNRDAVWKGMLHIELNTPNEDQEAIKILKSIKV